MLAHALYCTNIVRAPGISSNQYQSRRLFIELERAQAFAKQLEIALALDENDSDVHRILAAVHLVGGDHDEPEQIVERLAAAKGVFVGRGVLRRLVAPEHVAAGARIHQRLVQVPAAGHDVGKGRAAHEARVVARAELVCGHLEKGAIGVESFGNLQTLRPVAPAGREP